MRARVTMDHPSPSESGIMPYKLTRYDDLTVGQRASFTKTVTDADLGHFIAITGDTNPLHVDEPFASQTFFGGRIAHGMLSASLFSTLVGLHLPGIGAIYRSQTLEFLRAVHIGDTLTAWFEITGVDPAAERIDIASWIENQRGERVVEGQTVASLLRG
jgi:acyl dehydratase